MSKDFFEQVSADKSQLGFDYQDLVCLEYLIDLKQGESIGLEVFDDVHHAKVSGVKTLVQVKHSVNDEANLTNSDLDLWKTLYNWSMALDQPDVGDIEFVFFTNKNKTEQKGIVHLLVAETADTPKLIVAINDIKQRVDEKESKKDKGSSENPIKKYVDHIHNLSEEKKTKLFGRINMIFSADDIFQRLSKKIEYFSISESEALTVVHQLIGVFRKQKYKIVKSGEKVLIDYEMFRNDFQFNRIIQISADRKVDFSRYHDFKNVNDINPKEGLFARQLADIDIHKRNITDYAMEYAATSMFIQRMIFEGRFSETENEAVNSEVFYAWRSLHRQLYNTAVIENDSIHKQVAKDCLYKMEDAHIQVANSDLSRPMVVGKGIELSDKCRIGWRKDWYDLYGNSK